eukprot:4362952-Prymnesium_polylepis.1
MDLVEKFLQYTIHTNESLHHKQCGMHASRAWNQCLCKSWRKKKEEDFIQSGLAKLNSSTPRWDDLRNRYAKESLSHTSGDTPLPSAPLTLSVAQSTLEPLAQTRSRQIRSDFAQIIRRFATDSRKFST